ncbi:hypothetical protein AB0C15_23080 [Micromonospora sp. NPDC048835]|uniref:hypothetical protein n=1 Tax=Micromonospora sp. NPDC048835 TaxID=3155147 RepID=UPI0033DD256A
MLWLFDGGCKFYKKLSLSPGEARSFDAHLGQIYAFTDASLQQPARSCQEEDCMVFDLTMSDDTLSFNGNARLEYSVG